MGTQRRRWSKSEHEALKAFYPVVSAKRLEELLPGRTAKAIQIESSEMGLKKRPERLAEMGRENIAKRYQQPGVFKEPEPPVQ